MPPAAHSRRAAFTLVEVMVAMSILALAAILVLGAHLAAAKRAVHTQNTLKGAQELRFASDFISEATRSAPQTPLVLASGRQLLLAPRDLACAVVLETTWIDPLHDIKGSKSNQRLLRVSDLAPTAVVASVFRSDARPAGPLSAADVPMYFTDTSALPPAELADLFSVGDTLVIPATAYGPETTRIINAISASPGAKAITLTADLGVDVPNGTRLAATSGRRLLFTVEDNGDLRYYPDRRDSTNFVILARDIDPAPLADPANLSSPRTTPFAVTGRLVTLNLQKLPRGTLAGRTVLGVQTTAHTRTDPLAP